MILKALKKRSDLLDINHCLMVLMFILTWVHFFFPKRTLIFLVIFNLKKVSQVFNPQRTGVFWQLIKKIIRSMYLCAVSKGLKCRNCHLLYKAPYSTFFLKETFSLVSCNFSVSLSFVSSIFSVRSSLVSSILSCRYSLTGGGVDMQPRLRKYFTVKEVPPKVTVYRAGVAI